MLRASDELFRSLILNIKQKFRYYLISEESFHYERQILKTKTDLHHKKGILGQIGNAGWGGIYKPNEIKLSSSEK